jgi:hypothetical protein
VESFLLKPLLFSISKLFSIRKSYLLNTIVSKHFETDDNNAMGL